MSSKKYKFFTEQKFSGKTSTISETAEAVYIYSLTPSSDVKK